MSSSDDGMTVWLEDILINEDESLLGVIRTVASEGRPEASRSLSILSKNYLFFSFSLSRLRVEKSLDAFLTIDRRELKTGSRYHG